MSWLNELYFTYGNQYGVDNDCKTPLSPVAHMLAHAQIEITLDEMGVLQRQGFCQRKKILR